MGEVSAEGLALASRHVYDMQYFDPEFYAATAQTSHRINESSTHYSRNRQYYTTDIRRRRDLNYNTPAYYDASYETGSRCRAGTSTQTSPATVQWLLDNYETAEGEVLPRRTLYESYLQHCNGHNFEPVNMASFGKLIRSVFLGLKTRRLGTRGNSKYHYYGLRVKPNSSLFCMIDDNTSNSIRNRKYVPKS